MDAGQVLRAVRRHTGYSQRELARAAGVPVSTVSEIESGRRSPTTATLERVLRAAHLDLVLSERVGEPDPSLVRHLRLSTSQRLWRYLGGAGGIHPTPQRGPAFAALRALVASARLARVPVVLQGRSALGVWVPGMTAVLPLVVTVTAPLPATVHVDPALLALDDAPVRGGLAAVGVDQRSAVAVATPATLLLDPSCSPEREALRQALCVLHEGGARDDAGRRVPAHRDAREDLEYWRMFHNKAYRPPQRHEPSLLDSRSWRLDQPASARQWRRRNGYRA